MNRSAFKQKSPFHRKLAAALQLVSVCLMSFVAHEAGYADAVFTSQSGPKRAARREYRQDRRRDRQEFRQERRQDRQEFRQDRRQDRQERRQDRRELRQEIRGGGAPASPQ